MLLRLFIDAPKKLSRYFNLQKLPTQYITDLKAIPNQQDYPIESSKSSNMQSLKRAFHKSIIPAVTIGSILEYYELGLAIYWAPVIEKIFYDPLLPVTETINTISALLVGFFARPLGAFLFGRKGDRKGRKNAFFLTVILISIPTFAIGLPLPISFTDWSLFATFYISIMKFLQGIPAGGELPGAICYLAEESNSETEKLYTCSFAFVGPQIGLLFSIGVCLLFQTYFSHEFILNIGWHLTFLSCGLLGILGYFLRRKLHETHEYQLMRKNHRVVKRPVRAVFHNPKKVLLGYGLSLFEVTAFCILTIVPVFYYEELFSMTKNQILLMNVSVLTGCIILPPLIGKLAQILAERKCSIPLMEISAWGTILLSPFIYYSVSTLNFEMTIFLQVCFVILFSIQFALLPSLIANLFPTGIRYTGIGFTFNICDGILWALLPMLISHWVSKTENISIVFLLFPITASIFLIAYRYWKKHKNHKHLRMC